MRAVNRSIGSGLNSGEVIPGVLSHCSLRIAVQSGQQRDAKQRDDEACTLPCIIKYTFTSI